MSPFRVSHHHRWDNQSGQMLHCTECGELWPGEPDWPPPYVPRVEGSHVNELRAGNVMSVTGMIRALREMG